MKAPRENENLTWKAAATVVLRDAGRAMHYQEIADEIVSRGFREHSWFGGISVNKIINDSVRLDGDSSPFVRVAPGTFILRETAAKRATKKKR